MNKLKFSTKPWKHQKEALKYFMPRSFGALYTDMGSGKTKIMIDLIINRGFKRVLIVCPKKVCDVWPTEFSKHAFNGNISVLDVSELSSDRKVTKAKESLSDCEFAQQVFVVNYESVWREPFRSFLLKKAKLDCVICDESHKIKSPASKCSRFLTLLGKRVENRFIMTGTVMSQSPIDVYAQYRFLDDTIFGTSIQRFKEQYCNLIQVSGGYTLLDKKKPYKNLDELHDKMFSCAFKTDTELDLPETQDITLEYNMSSKAEKYYKELQKEGVLELKQGTLEAGNILTVITRLQQLTSGYIPLEDDDGNVTVTQVDDTRQEALRELLEGLPEEEPIVIFAKYRKDIKNIRKLAKEMGRKSSEVSGAKNTLKNWKDGKTTILVVQIASGAEGIDLTRARYCVYYTLTHSLGQYLQSRKRVHRPGQTRPVVYYTLVSKMKKGNTIDEKIIESLKNNKSIIDSIMETGEI